MQNKQALIGIVAAAIILLGAGGVFLYSQNKPSEQQPNSTTTATKEENKDSSIGSTLTELLKSGKTQQCNFSYDDVGSGKTEGVTYISGENMRTDLTTTNLANKKSAIYIVRNGDDSYIWGSEFPNSTGLKMTISVDEYMNNESAKDYFDPNKKVNYDCKSWVTNASIFTPPANVKFTDLSAMMQGFTNSTKTTGSPTGSSNSQCSACNSLTGDAKTACMSSLGC